MKTASSKNTRRAGDTFPLPGFYRADIYYPLLEYGLKAALPPLIGMFDYGGDSLAFDSLYPHQVPGRILTIIYIFSPEVRTIAGPVLSLYTAFPSAR